MPLWILNLLNRGIDEAAQEPFESWRQLGFRCSLALFSAACCNRRGLQSQRISRQTSTLRRASLLPTPSAFSAPHPLKHPFCTHVPEGGGRGGLHRTQRFGLYSTECFFVIGVHLKVPSTKSNFLNWEDPLHGSLFWWQFEWDTWFYHAVLNLIWNLDIAVKPDLK